MWVFIPESLSRRVPKNAPPYSSAHPTTPKHATEVYCHNIFSVQRFEEKEGIIGFYSKPFSEDADFYGKVRLNMKVRSSCEDTAFFMRVYFTEDGRDYNLTETITSLSNIDDDAFIELSLSHLTAEDRHQGKDSLADKF